jgi:outer membrane receptor protein involved in Fe transport
MKKSLVAALVVVGAGGAVAQPQPGSITDIEVPNVVIDTSDATTSGADEALDLANIVQSAAKGVTTVQEAPAIVTVITADEIRDRQFTNFEQIYDLVPGWQKLGYANSSIDLPVVRGTLQAVQFLHDGLSLFDPFANVASTSRIQPLELIKRVEAITGPGGVLWGSNSLLGILNVITKDAEDVDGVEVGGTLGDGRGDRAAAHAYVMVGKSDMLDGKMKVFGHASVETYQGTAIKQPLLIFHDPIPTPNSPNQYGPLTESDQMRSMIVSFNAKVSYEKFQLRVSAPFGHKRNPIGVSGEPANQNQPQDSRCPLGTTDATCSDPLRIARDSKTDNYDRYAVLDYRTRFAGDKAGLTARVYGIQFLRDFSPIQVLAPTPLLQGGLSFRANLVSYRAGAQLDGDVELTRKLRLQYGAEAFTEWKPDDIADGNQSTLPSPLDLTHLPLLCPRIYDATKMAIVPVPDCLLTFAFPASRTVMGAYANPQWRPTKKLIFDIGGRLQAAPEQLGKLTYPLTSTVAGTMVWNFIPNWHLKLNYGQGFRPPAFNNIVANGEGVQIGGNPNLKVETSDAMQAEVNARVYKGERRIRELSFRFDGSYTRLNNLIQITSGSYANSGKRGISSAEFLGKLFISGGHRIELAYTWLRVDTNDHGRLRTIPEHWFDLATVFSLATHVTMTTDLKIMGATEDANRLADYRDSSYAPNGDYMNPIQTNATDMVMDRLPPTAQLNLGIAWMPTPKLMFRATVADALVSHAYQPDVVSDYEPHIEYLPNPYEGFRAYISAVFQY